MAVLILIFIVILFVIFVFHSVLSNDEFENNTTTSNSNTQSNNTKSSNTKSNQKSGYNFRDSNSSSNSSSSNSSSSYSSSSKSKSNNSDSNADDSILDNLIKLQKDQYNQLHYITKTLCLKIIDQNKSFRGDSEARSHVIAFQEKKLKYKLQQVHSEANYNFGFDEGPIAFNYSKDGMLDHNLEKCEIEYSVQLSRLGTCFNRNLMLKTKHMSTYFPTCRKYDIYIFDKEEAFTVILETVKAIITFLDFHDYNVIIPLIKQLADEISYSEKDANTIIDKIFTSSDVPDADIHLGTLVFGYYQATTKNNNYRNFKGASSYKSPGPARPKTSASSGSSSSFRSSRSSSSSSSRSSSSSSGARNYSSSAYSQVPKGRYGKPNVDRRGSPVHRGFFANKSLLHLDEVTENAMNGFVIMVYVLASLKLDKCDKKLLALITHDVCKEVLNRGGNYQNIYLRKDSYLAFSACRTSYTRPLIIPPSIAVSKQPYDLLTDRYQLQISSLITVCTTAKDIYDSIDYKRISYYEGRKTLLTIFEHDLIIFDANQLLLLTCHALRIIFDEYGVKPNVDMYGALVALFIGIFEVDEGLLTYITSDLLDLSEVNEETRKFSAIDPVELKQAYRTLECSENDDMDTIRRKKRTLLNRWHPDRASEYNRDLYTEESQKINAAFDLIEKSRKSKG